jgi:hypothetical protein
MTIAYPGTVEVVTFTIAEGNPGGTVTITVRDPNGTRTTYTSGTDPQITHPSPGVYVLTIPCPLAGTWNARLVAAGGALAGAYEISWKVKTSAF